MALLDSWSDSASERVPVETTLSDLGHDQRYISIIKKVFKIGKTPVTRQAPGHYLLSGDFCRRDEFKAADRVSFTHTGQEVYPFGESCLKSLNRVCEGKGALIGSSASNCVSTFKLVELHSRQKKPEKHVIFTCDTGFTGILREIPQTTVTGDARSGVCLSGDKGRYKVTGVYSTTYSQHYGGAWETDEYRNQYEQQYTDRIVALAKKAMDRTRPSATASILLVPHNVNVYTWNAITRKLNDERVAVYTGGVENNGHCFGSDAFLNLDFINNEPGFRDNPPDYYFCITAGVGGFFSLVVMQENESRPAVHLVGGQTQ